MNKEEEHESDAKQIRQFMQCFQSFLSHCTEDLHKWEETAQGADEQVAQDRFDITFMQLRVAMAFPLLEEHEKAMIVKFGLIAESAVIINNMRGAKIPGSDNVADRGIASLSAAYKKVSERIASSGLLEKLTPVQVAVLYGYFGRAIPWPNPRNH